MKAGASGYLLKRVIGDKLPEALQEARAGGLPLTRHMAAKVGQYFQQFGKRQKEARTEVTEITYAVGFSDLKHFRSLFQEHFGVLPGEYARKAPQEEYAKNEPGTTAPRVKE